MLDVDRSKDENGKSIVLLRCKQPEVAKKVLAEILGEEYIEPEIEETDLPEKRKEWWQRSIQRQFGGDNRGDANEMRNDIASYRKRFQSDTFREDADRYAKAFHGDVENISKRMFGGANERERTTIERYSEVKRAKGREVLEKPGSKYLSEAEMGVLEVISELKDKRRMSKVLSNDVLRRGQTKCKGVREDNVGAILKGLWARGYLSWIMPGYELTRKGKEVLNA